MTIGKRIKQLREGLGFTLKDIAGHAGVAVQTIFKYENGIVTNIPLDKIEKIATALDTTPSYLMGWTDEPAPKYKNIMPIEVKKVPFLGAVACGEPIFREAERESYCVLGAEIGADFCLECVGDSMINARINNGDIVFCRRQEQVENGEIAVVAIGDEATLKRVVYYPEKNMLILKPENPRFQDMIYTDEALNDIRILGKAVAFQSDVY